MRFYLSKIRVSDEGMDRVYNKRDGPEKQRDRCDTFENPTQWDGEVVVVATSTMMRLTMVVDV
jgi:hypothetical protein